MTRTFRLMLMSTGLGAAALALPWPGGEEAQAQDSAMCMQDVAALRERPSLGLGGDSRIDASANAAEQACMAGNYGLASAYIADAERQLTLTEAQRDESTAVAGEVSAAETGLSTAALSPDTDDDDTVADDAEDIGDDITGTAEDVGDDLEDVGDDVGDALDDAFGDDDDPEANVSVAESAAFQAAVGRTPSASVGIQASAPNADADDDGISDDVDDAADDIEDTASDVGDEVADTAEDVGDEVDDAANDVGDEVADAFSDDDDPEANVSLAESGAFQAAVDGTPSAGANAGIQGDSAGTASAP